MLVALIHIQMRSPLARSSIVGCSGCYLSGSGSTRNDANPLSNASVLNLAADLLELVRSAYQPIPREAANNQTNVVISRGITCYLTLRGDFGPPKPNTSTSCSVALESCQHPNDCGYFLGESIFGKTIGHYGELQTSRRM